MASSILLLVALLACGADPKGKPPANAKPNRLAKESSPYLLQHAYNPVDWHAWGPEALAKAKKEGKLIFLSVGYSSCHWCHVMERESFSNADVAKLLNENFICIKVDREERPDIDEIYLTALQVQGSNGGWPLSMFLTPEAKPIFGGTYWPLEDRKVDEDTIPGFKTILQRVMTISKDKKAELLKQGDALAEQTAATLERATLGIALVKFDDELIRDAISEFEIDPEHGGLGSKARGFRGTKFPRASALHFLLQQSQKKEQAELAKLVALTLDKMATGGIYDHLGGGFHRYSTERTWTVPHFEKMLYDQAQLVELYANAYQYQPQPQTQRVIRETLDFVTRELMAPEGYFYSALDADSDGHEGEFYVWTEKEIDDAIGDPVQAKFFKSIYATEGKNFEEKKIILKLPRSLGKLAEEQKLTEEALLAKLAPLKKKLFDVRAKRNRPFLDTKLIVAWNGQMIAAFARAGQVLQEPKYIQVAEKAAEFLQSTMRDQSGRLLRIYAAKTGEKPEARGPSFLDDHAYLMHGLIALHTATKKQLWLDRSLALLDQTNKWYGDGKRAGYFSTPSDGEKLFARGKDGYDGAQPSCNGTMALNLTQLAIRTKNPAILAQAESLAKLYGRPLKATPTAVPLVASAVELLLANGSFREAAVTPQFAPPANPKESAEVVKATLGPRSLADDLEHYTVTLQVAKGWHIYANPVGSKDLAESATTLEVLVDGQKATLIGKIEYPRGKPHKGPDGEYQIYEGEIGITFHLGFEETRNKEKTIKIKVIACNEKMCLKPSTIAIKVK